MAKKAAGGTAPIDGVDGRTAGLKPGTYTYPSHRLPPGSLILPVWLMSWDITPGTYSRRVYGGVSGTYTSRGPGGPAPQGALAQHAVARTGGAGGE